MAILDYLDDWKLDFDSEIDEPKEQEAQETLEVTFRDYLDAFDCIDPKEMTMH